jgi:hypothetical protein
VWSRSTFPDIYLYKCIFLCGRTTRVLIIRGCDWRGGRSWRERGEMAPAVRLGAQQAHKSSVPAAAARVHPRHVDTPDKQAINPALKEPLGSIPFIQPLSHVLRPLYCMHMCARQRRGAHSSPINHTHQNVYTNARRTHLLTSPGVKGVSRDFNRSTFLSHTGEFITLTQCEIKTHYYVFL